MAPTPCLDCGRIAKGLAVPDLRERPQPRQPVPDAAWRRLSREVVARDGACVRCGGQFRRVPAVSAHHILRRAAGGPDSPGNLVTLCASCHARVEAATATAAYLTGASLLTSDARLTARGEYRVAFDTFLRSHLTDHKPPVSDRLVHLALAGGSLRVSDLLRRSTSVGHRAFLSRDYVCPRAYPGSMVDDTSAPYLNAHHIRS